MLSRVSARSYSSAAQSIKLTAREAPGNLSTLSVVVNNAGSKAGKSGVAHLLSKYNFLNNEAKSALRFTRESELLGGIVSSDVTRDSIVLKTQFLKQDLPYFVEALGNVLTKTSFRDHELPETVLPAAKAQNAEAQGSNAFKAFESLHEISFRKGLGNPLYYDGTSPISVDEIKQFASEAYNTSNVSVFGSGVNEGDLKKFIGESAFSALPAGASKTTSVELHNGKESRIRAAGGSVALIGVPIKTADFAKYEVLSAAIGSTYLPGSSAPLSQIPGAISKVLKYQDAGLFVICVCNSDAAVVAQGVKAAKKAVDSVSASDLSSATKAAELAVALQSRFESPVDVKIDASAAKSPAKLSEFNYVAVGNVDLLPYANEL